ncbi:transposable element Tcb2 transposase [Trichonephila clavipes]|nr:transposable element Tcb2 transposase [Trichonephila clavipes]
MGDSVLFPDEPHFSLNTNSRRTFIGREPFHAFERGFVAGVRYRDAVWKPYVYIFRGACGPEFIVMDNNARPHRTLLVDEFLEREDIRCMHWLTKSPDLYPMDHVWDALRRALRLTTPLREPSRK